MTDECCMQAILSSLGGSRAAFRGVFIVYGAYCSLWIPLSLWVIPKKSLQLGQVWRPCGPYFYCERLTSLLMAQLWCNAYKRNVLGFLSADEKASPPA